MLADEGFGGGVRNDQLFGLTQCKNVLSNNLVSNISTEKIDSTFLMWLGKSIESFRKDLKRPYIAFEKLQCILVDGGSGER